jgi:hypothetical protein
MKKTFKLLVYTLETDTFRMIDLFTFSNHNKIQVILSIFSLKPMKSLSRSSILHFQHTLDKKPLGKIENTITTAEKIHRRRPVATRHTKHTLRYRRAVIWVVLSGNWRGNYWGGDRRYRIIRVKALITGGRKITWEWKEKWSTCTSLGRLRFINHNLFYNLWRQEYTWHVHNYMYIKNCRFSIKIITICIPQARVLLWRFSMPHFSILHHSLLLQKKKGEKVSHSNSW